MQVQVVVDRLSGQRGKRGSSGTLVPVQQRDEMAFQGWFAVEKGKMRADPVRRAQVPFEAPFERGVAEVGQRRMHPGDHVADFGDQPLGQPMLVEGGAGQQCQSPDQTLFAMLIRAIGDQITPSRGQDLRHGHALDRLQRMDHGGLEADVRRLAPGPHDLDHARRACGVFGAEVEIVFAVERGQNRRRPVAIAPKVRDQPSPVRRGSRRCFSTCSRGGGRRRAVRTGCHAAFLLSADAGASGGLQGLQTREHVHSLLL